MLKLNIVEVRDTLWSSIDRVIISPRQITDAVVRRTGRVSACTKTRISSIKELKKEHLRFTDLVIVGEVPFILFYKIILKDLHFDSVFIVSKKRGKIKINF